MPIFRCRFHYDFINIKSWLNKKKENKVITNTTLNKFMLLKINISVQCKVKTIKVF